MKKTKIKTLSGGGTRSLLLSFFVAMAMVFFSAGVAKAEIGSWFDTQKGVLHIFGCESGKPRNPTDDNNAIYKTIREDYCTFKESYANQIKRIVIHKAQRPHSTKPEWSPYWEGVSYIKNITCWFRNLPNLEEVTGFEYFRFSGLTTLAGLFYECPKLKRIEGPLYLHKEIEDISYMFCGCKDLRYIEIGRFGSTAGVTQMQYLFYDCINLEQIFSGDWEIDGMKNQPSKHYEEMFTNCDKLRGDGENGVPYYHKDHPDEMGYVNNFYFLRRDHYLSAYPKDNAKDEYYAYYNIGSKTLVFCYDKFKTYGCYSLIYDPYPGWMYQDIRRVVLLDNIITNYFDYWFKGQSNLVEIESLSYHFSSSKTMTMAHMFDGCSSLEDFDYNIFPTAKDCKEFNYLFNDCQSLSDDVVNGVLSKLDLSNAEDVRLMFANCTNLTSIVIDNKMPKVEDMRSMFKGCTYLKTVRFGEPSSMTKVQYTNSMFYNCSRLERIFVPSNIDFSKVTGTNGDNMFYGCSSLKGTLGTKVSNTGVANARLDKSDEPGYFTAYISQITYEYNGGSHTYSTPKTYKVDDKDKTIADPYRSGFIFKGWTCTGGMNITTPTKSPVIKTGTIGDITFTAHWIVSMSNTDIIVTPESNFYTGANIPLVVKYNGTTLVKDKDYKYTASIKDAKSYSVSIEGIGNYGGSKTFTITIKKKPVTVTPDADQYKYYGTTEDPVIKYTTKGLIGSNVLSGQLSRVTGDLAGTYAITVGSLTHKNYAPEVAEGALFTIKPKEITVTPNPASLVKQYGTEDPILNYTSDGLQDEDKLEGSLVRDKGEEIGQYNISIGTLANPNYNITLTPTKFSIIQRSIDNPCVLLESEVFVLDEEGKSEPSVIVYDGTKMVDPSEYSVSYTNNNKTGTGIVTVETANRHYYFASTSKNFTIINNSDAVTVTYKDQNNNVIKTTYAQKNKPTTKPQFVVEGYTIEGVYKDKSCTQLFDFATNVSSNLVLYIKWNANKHKISFILDGVTYGSDMEIGYGTTISYPTPDMPEGYSFSGWNPAPETMPDYDFIAEGSSIINTHTITYIIDGKVDHMSTFKYNADITLESNPANKTGYTFSNWIITGYDALPSKMPDADIEINGNYIPNKHTFRISYTDPDDEIKTETKTVAFGTKLSDVFPKFTGYVFVPSSSIPETMPDQTLEISGKYELGKYTLTYLLNGKEHKKLENLTYNTTITPLAAPAVEAGYYFTGWEGEPKTMPDIDLVVRGYIKGNEHTITYMLDGEVYKTVKAEYGSKITTPTTPFKAGFTFSGWNGLPETMPDNDLTVTGSLTKNGTTPVATLPENADEAKVWSYNGTIYIETLPDTKYTITDLNGRILTTSTTKSTHDEIQLNVSGILIVTLGKHSFKVMN